MQQRQLRDTGYSHRNQYIPIIESELNPSSVAAQDEAGDIMSRRVKRIRDLRIIAPNALYNEGSKKTIQEILTLTSFAQDDELLFQLNIC